MLTCLRQCLVSPLTPLAKIALDLFNYGSFNELAAKFDSHINKLDIDNYLANPNNIISSRISKVLERTNQHKKVVIFTAFRSSVNILMHILSNTTNKYVATLEGLMSLKKRTKILDNLKKCDNFVFILTYKIGSSGLNIQEADTIITVDYDWNTCTTNQAIARVLRQGQKQNVNIHHIYSNSGVENAIFQKQLEKTSVREQLMTGPAKTTIKKIKVQEIITILEEEALSDTFSKLYLNNYKFEDTESIYDDLEFEDDI